MTEDTGVDEQYHLEVSAGDVAETVLLPGDPDRVETITAGWDRATTVADHREYRTVTGQYDDTELSVTSTGIGSPSAAIAVEELSAVGAETFVRVGSCGAVDETVEVGDLVISTGAVRLEGTSDDYVDPAYPAVADYEVVTALVTAAERLGYQYHLGVTASTDSFYVGQGRPGHENYLPAEAASFVDNLANQNVLAVEMETSAILTLCSLYGLRGGAVCTVFADRTAGAFEVTGERRAAETASLAGSLLAEMDDRDAEHWRADDRLGP